MYILDTTSRLQPSPTLHIIGSSGNDYEINVTPTSISCTCPDNNQACKHILFLLHQTLAIYRRGNDLFVHPPTLIEKINNGKTLQSKYLSPLANNLCVCTHDAMCSICNLPLSGTATICSRCPTAHHSQCSIHSPPSCPCSSRPYIGLKSTIAAKGYRNYSSILKHFSYPMRNPRQIANRRQNRRGNPILLLPPQNLFLPDNHRSANFVPPSPATTIANFNYTNDTKPRYL